MDQPLDIWLRLLASNQNSQVETKRCKKSPSPRQSPIPELLFGVLEPHQSIYSRLWKHPRDHHQHRAQFKYNNPVTLTIPSGSRVEGREGNSITKLTGPFTQITFTVTSENWHAIIVGIAPTVLVPCNDPSTLNLGTATGDFVTTPLPASYNIEGIYSTLYVGDFNCDNIDDFIKQENSDRPSSSEDDITVFLSNMTPASGSSPLFTKKTQSEVFEDASVLVPGGDQQSPIYLGDFNGDGREDDIQYFGGDCFAVIHALSGKCVNKANKCQKKVLLMLRNKS